MSSTFEIGVDKKVVEGPGAVALANKTARTVLALLADESDEIALTLDLQAQNTIAAVGVVKRHPFDEAI